MSLFGSPTQLNGVSGLLTTEYQPDGMIDQVKSFLGFPKTRDYNIGISVVRGEFVNRKSSPNKPLPCSLARNHRRDNVRRMRDLLLLATHLLVTLAKFLGPGGIRSVAAESLLLKHQLLISNRSRHRAPNLSTLDRFLLALITLFVNPRRIPKLSAIFKPATLFKFHKALVDRKYRLLFSFSSLRRKPGPKGPSTELIAAIVESKRRNPKFDCVRIAQQIAHAFGIEIDKDVVRRVLAKHYGSSDSGTNGPSWLTFIGHVKDSLWSGSSIAVGCFRHRSPPDCEFATHKVDFHPRRRRIGGEVDQAAHLRLGQHDREDAVLEAVIVEDVGDARRDHAAYADV